MKVRELYLFFDSFGGQSKNYKTKFYYVHITFPIEAIHTWNSLIRKWKPNFLVTGHKTSNQQEKKKLSVVCLTKIVSDIGQHTWHLPMSKMPFQISTNYRDHDLERASKTNETSFYMPWVIYGLSHSQQDQRARETQNGSRLDYTPLNTHSVYLPCYEWDAL